MTDGSGGSDASERIRETSHRIHEGDARSLAALATDAVELVVTSPPYPMIELWDGLFAALDDDVAPALDRGDGDAAFEAMHGVLDAVWDELARVVAPGGVVCVNVGDATRTLDGPFQVYPNHARVIEAFRERGFHPLPDILWRKPANSSAKFMGSGMVPPSAYATLEHEYVLVFRNGPRRAFDPGDPDRYESAYFWEERNDWFSDVWTDVRGIDQGLPESLRERSAAFPLAVPYRLINMYSVYGDTVLDPFWGTGTTTLAAMVAGRNSVGYELDADLIEAFESRVEGLAALGRRVVGDRLDAHREFVADRAADDEPLPYEAVHHDTRVATEQERRIRLYRPVDVEPTGQGYAVTHRPADLDD